MKLSAGAFSDTGHVRGNNEDAHVVDDGSRCSRSPTAWAATAAARSPAGPRSKRCAPRWRTAGRCNDAITLANERGPRTGDRRPELTGMGTTMTAVVVAGGRRLLVGHVGDSRAYLLHDGSLRQLTDDHSLVEELVREGRLTAEQAESHPQRASSPARSASTPTSRSTCTRSMSSPATASCSAPTASPTWCASATSNASRAARPIRSARRSYSSTPRTRPAARTTSPSSSSTSRRSKPTPRSIPKRCSSTPIRRPRRCRRSRRTRPRPHRRHRAPRVVGRRVRGALLLLIPLLIVIGLAVGAVGWYARRSFYVGHRQQPGRGLPGRSGRRARLEPDRRATQRPHRGRIAHPVDQEAVADGAARGSRTKAEDYVVAAAVPCRRDVDDDHVDHHHDPADHHDATAPPPDGRAGRARDAAADHDD